MADDIVTSLRAEADAHADGDWNDQVIRRRFTEAADEIERLRGTLRLVVDMLEEDFPRTAQQYAMEALGEGHRG